MCSVIYCGNIKQGLIATTNSESSSNCTIYNAYITNIIKSKFPLTGCGH